MTTLLSPTRSDEAHEDAQLADDLGHVIESLIEGTAHGLVLQATAHDISMLEYRILRELDRGPGTSSVIEITERVALPESVVREQLDALLDRDIVIQRAGRVALTRHGRRIVQDIARARRVDLRAFVSDLDHRHRLRVEAAVHLLLGDLDRLAA